MSQASPSAVEMVIFPSLSSLKPSGCEVTFSIQYGRSKTCFNSSLQPPRFEELHIGRALKKYVLLSGKSYKVSGLFIANKRTVSLEFSIRYCISHVVASPVSVHESSTPYSPSLHSMFRAARFWILGQVITYSGPNIGMPPLIPVVSSTHNRKPGKLYFFTPSFKASFKLL